MEFWEKVKLFKEKEAERHLMEEYLRVRHPPLWYEPRSVSKWLFSIGVEISPFFMAEHLQKALEKGYSLGRQEAKVQETAGRIKMDAVKQAVSPMPSIGRIVRYTLTAKDACEINPRRTDQFQRDQWKMGSQAHVGTPALPGEVYPMMIVNVMSNQKEGPVNGQVFLDGNDVLWVKGVFLGDEPGCFSWPERT